MFRLIGAFFCQLVLLAASLAAAGEYPPDIGRIKQNGVLRVALVDHDVYPFLYESATGLDGIDIRLARRIARELDVEVQFIRTPGGFNGVVDYVASGKADIATSKISATLRRAQTVLFTEPYIVLHQALLFNRIELERALNGRSESEFIRQLNVPVGVLGDSSYESYLRHQFPQVPVHAYATWDEAVKSLFEREVAAIYRDDFEVKRVLYEQPNAALLAKSFTLMDRPDPSAIVVHWRDRHLRDWLNRLLAGLFAEPLRAERILQHPEQILSPH